MMKYGELINQYDSIGDIKNVCWILAGFGYLPKFHVGLEICNRIRDSSVKEYDVVRYNKL